MTARIRNRECVSAPPSPGVVTPAECRVWFLDDSLALTSEFNSSALNVTAVNSITKQVKTGTFRRYEKTQQGLALVGDSEAPQFNGDGSSEMLLCDRLPLDS